MSTVDPSRRLAAAVEPFAAGVYFAPECHEAYAALGFGGSPGKMGDVEMPDGPAYFCSRGSVMGQVTGEVVAAAFGVFNPVVVGPAVTHGWTITDAATIEAARTEGAVGQLRRILGPSPEGLDRGLALLHQAADGLRPEGKPLFAGLVAQGLPGEPLADAWRLADRLREYRGDVHINAWTGAGLDATEISLLTELYWGLPLRTYSRSRAWTDADFDAATERLEQRGLVADGAFTPEGRAAREAIEVATDQSVQPIVDALGDNLDDLVGILATWSNVIRDAGGYPPAGPQDLAGMAGG
ncbi:MAG TPA: hypothetical protein VHA73_09340 [Acidimicrobiales bacterium]|jgi:hypothetical protein|nr:hypothetical protein [Acidimicrobiales bacterium]